MNSMIGIFQYTLASFVVSGAMLLAQPPAAPGSTQPESETTTLVKQAQKLNSEGKQDEVLASYRKALEISPDDLDAHLGMGVVFDLKGDYPEAHRHLAKAIDIATPETRERALRTMAMSYAFECNVGEVGRLEQQIFGMRMARQDFLSAADVANEMARIYLECRDIDSAEKWYRTGYQTAIRKTDMSEADKKLWLFRWEHAQARLAARRGQREEAQQHVAAAKAALDKANNPDQASYYPYLTGYVAFYAGDCKTAISDLQRADQRDPFILSLLAQAYEKSGGQAQAMEYYRKVLTVNTHNPTNAFARPLAKKKVTAGK